MPTSYYEDTMTDKERYYWDLVGHLVLPGVLTPDEVAAANEALDHADDRMANGKDAYSDSLRQTANAAWLDGHLVRTHANAPWMLMLEPPHCEPFRKMLIHPEIVGRLREMCGAGFRLDNGPVFIGGIVGTPIHMLHGAGEPHKPSVSYDARNGTFFAGGVTVAYLLADAGPDDGGFTCVPGSHKSRYPIPPGVRTMEDEMGCVETPKVKAGGALFFMDGAQTHGARPWKAAHPRRTVLFKYACRTAARRASAIHDVDPEQQWDAEILEGMTPEQRAVMYGPSSQPKTDGPYLEVDEGGVVRPDLDWLPSLKTHSDTFVQG